MERYVGENPKNKFGAHRYDSGEFGLSDEEINDSFSKYEISV